MNHARVGFSALVVVMTLLHVKTATASDRGPMIVDFEDLAVGSSWNVGDTQITSGITMSFEEFFWSSGTPTSNGHSEIWNNQWSGGTGHDIETNNITIAFDFGGPVTDLSLLYGEFGGNVNLTVNDDFRNLGGFDALDGTMVGGVLVTITNTRGSTAKMSFDGTVESFSIGGQELWMDSVTFNVPEPGGAALLIGAIVMVARRRRRLLHRG